MNAELAHPARTIYTSTAPAAWRAFAGCSLAQFGLFTGTLVMLGSAIGWPGILREPAARVLTTIHAQAFATAVGYSLYLAASVALIGLALLLGRVFKSGTDAPLWVDLVTVLGIAAGVLQTLGIVRWLTVMPGLAATYSAAGTPTALLPTIELLYSGLNAYAGGVGEMLGVQLFGGLWFAGVGALLWRGHWKLSGGLAVLSGALFLLINLRIFFDGIGTLNTIAGPLGLAWYLVLAVTAWHHRVAAGG